jgi:hypothetical protein
MDLVSQWSLQKPIIEEVEQPILPIDPKLSEFKWYKDVFFYLHHLKCSTKCDKDRDILVKLKAVKYCIIDQKLFWKDPRGIILNCITEE